MDEARKPYLPESDNPADEGSRPEDLPLNENLQLERPSLSPREHVPSKRALMKGFMSFEKHQWIERLRARMQQKNVLASTAEEKGSPVNGKKISNWLNGQTLSADAAEFRSVLRWLRSLPDYEPQPRKPKRRRSKIAQIDDNDRRDRLVRLKDQLAPLPYTLGYLLPDSAPNLTRWVNDKSAFVRRYALAAAFRELRQAAATHRYVPHVDETFSRRHVPRGYKRKLADGYAWLDEKSAPEDQSLRERLNALCVQKGIPFNYNQEALGAPHPPARVSNWRRGFADSAPIIQLNEVFAWLESLPDVAKPKIVSSKHPKPAYVDVNKKMKHVKLTHAERIWDLKKRNGLGFRALFQEHENPPISLKTLYYWLASTKKKPHNADRHALSDFFRWARKYRSPFVNFDRAVNGGVSPRKKLKKLFDEVGFYKNVVRQNWPRGPVTHAQASSWLQSRRKNVERKKLEFVISTIEDIKVKFSAMAAAPAKEVDEPVWKTEFAEFARLIVTKDKDAQRAMFAEPESPMTRLEALRWATGREIKVEFREFLWVYNGLKKLPYKGLVGNYNAGAGNDKPEPVSGTDRTLHGKAQTPHATVPATSLEQLPVLLPKFTTSVANVDRDDGKVPFSAVDRDYLDEMILVTGVSPAEAVSRFPGGSVTALEIAGLQSGAVTLIETSKWVWTRGVYENLTGFEPTEPTPASGLHASR